MEVGLNFGAGIPTRLVHSKVVDTRKFVGIPINGAKKNAI